MLIESNGEIQVFTVHGYNLHFTPLAICDLWHNSTETSYYVSIAYSDKTCSSYPIHKEDWDELKEIYEKQSSPKLEVKNVFFGMEIE